MFAKDSSSRRPRTRWWGLLLLLGLAAVAVIRFAPSWSYQQKNMYSMAAGLVWILLLLLWTALFFPGNWRRRLAAAGTAVLVLATGAALFRIKGVSGDLLPILEFRWSGNPAFPQETGAGDALIVSPPTSPGRTNDYPQFQGPNRTGIVPVLPLAENWDRAAPRLVWKRMVGAGWSGFAIVGSLAVTQEQQGEREATVSYELHSGKVVWTHSNPVHYHTTIAGEGPRATPTLTSERAYVMGATGLLDCLDLLTGRVLWSRNVPEEQHASIPEWGVSCSPLLMDDRIIVSTGARDGRALAAYSAESGKLLWTAGEDRASYSSPTAALLLGQPQVLSFNSASITGHDPETGVVLWKHPWPSGHPHISTPLVLSSNRVLVSSGYGVGAELLQIDRAQSGGWRAQRLWKSNRLKSKFANLLQLGDYIYGLDDGILVCLDARTGELKWKEGRYGHGQMILAGRLLLLLAENGDLVLLEPVPEGERRLARFTLLHGKTWNPPALAGEYLLVRNDQEAACYRLPTRPR